MILLQIKLAYPSFEMTNDAINMWTQFLLETDAEMAAQNLKEHIRGSKFPPTIHEIVKENDAVLFRRKKQQSKLQQRNDEERMRIAVAPPWVKLGISQREYEDRLLLKGEDDG